MFEKYLLSQHMGVTHHGPPKITCCFPPCLKVRKMLFSDLEIYASAAKQSAVAHMFSSSCVLVLFVSQLSLQNNFLFQ